MKTFQSQSLKPIVILLIRLVKVLAFVSWFALFILLYLESRRESETSRLSEAEGWVFLSFVYCYPAILGLIHLIYTQRIFRRLLLIPDNLNLKESWTEIKGIFNEVNYYNFKRNQIKKSIKESIGMFDDYHTMELLYDSKGNLFNGTVYHYVGKEFYWIGSFEYGMKHGPWKIRGHHYWEHGNYLRNEKEGKWENRFSDGVLHSIVTYREGLKHGLHEEYLENGGILKRGFYSEDKEDGEWYELERTDTVPIYNVRLYKDGVQVKYMYHGHKGLLAL